MRPLVEQTRRRQGSRAAHAIEIPYWRLDPTVPRHGQFPGQIAHLDHSQVDLELVNSRTGENMGRPYRSTMTCATPEGSLQSWLASTLRAVDLAWL